VEIQNVNQQLRNLVPDSQSDIEILKLTEGPMSLWLARLQKDRQLAAHYHREGAEIYQVLDGEGVIELGRVSASGVQWFEEHPVSSGDLFEIPPGIVHRLSSSAQGLNLIFVTADSHLSSDRTFI
jgi:mannose-6-phosphate isomerase-like protein (cupin superfamily)